MTTSVEQINAWFQERKKNQEPFMAKMRDIAELANGDVRVVHAELDVNEKATVVNLFPGGLDALATRAASVQPDQVWPPLRDGFQGSEDRARDRRQAGLAWWDMNSVPLMDRLRFRHYFGWGTTPVTVLPTSPSKLDKRDIPHWRARSPLTAYPAPCEDRLDMVPPDAIFACRRTRKWLTDMYGTQMARLNTGPRDQQRPDDMFELLEYIDCEEIVLCVAGRSSNNAGLWTPSGYAPQSMCIELERIPNKAEQPLAVFPGRITLDRLQGALDQMLPAYHKAAKLDSLNLLAIARGIFPDQWLVGHPGDPQAPEIITDPNGLAGIIGEAAHGQIITLGNPPAAAQAAEQSIDRLERSQRLVSGLPAELGGESASNIRTARRGEQVLGSAIDMPIQEAQEILAESKEAELRCGVGVQNGWFGSKKTSFYIPRNGKLPAQLDYTPEETFETDECYVKYSMPGTDANSLVIALGQRVNMGTMSIQTAMETDPVIEDPVEERDRVEMEGILRALLASIEQGVQQGSIGPEEVALIAKAKYGSHEQLWDVVINVHSEMQAKQAAQGQLPAGAPAGQPGLGGPPPSPFSGTPPQPALQDILQANGQPAQQTPQLPAAAPALTGS